MELYTTKEGENFFESDFPIEIWGDNYRNKNETIEETCWRQVNTIFANESQNLKNLLYDALINKRIFFGGRVVANVGTDYKNVSFFNCYSIQRTKKPYDSIDGIYADLEKFAQILKTEGGVGGDFSHLRPRGTLIKGVRVPTPGVVSFLELYDKSSSIITEAGTGTELIQYDGKGFKKKSRKGAMLSLLRVEHPDIIDYIEAKKYSNRLTKFNMSVGITDEFMEAVRNNEEWNLWFPDIHEPNYDTEWDGDFDAWKEKGYNCIVYKTIQAKELWYIILKHTYNKNEPGIIFLGNANRNNILKCIGQKIVCVNPCGEIVMISDTYEIEHDYKKYTLKGDICNLGGLVFTSYYNKISGFDYQQMTKDIQLLVRALDNLIDISNYPFEEIENSAKFRRKLGCGFLGYGSLLFMMGMRYGSKDANEFTTILSEFYTNQAFRASADIAKEKGVFPLWKNEMFDCGFLSKDILSSDTKAYIKACGGLRNSALMTCAPTGNNGIYMGVKSGGVEPLFDIDYMRWVNVNHKYQTEFGDKVYPNVSKGEWFETVDFKFHKNGDDEILKSTCGKFFIDKDANHKKEIQCQDYGWKWVAENYSKDEISKMKKDGIFATSKELSVDEHLSPFIIWSNAIDNAISKTINLANDYPFDDFDKLFFNAWENGVRGFTTYRDGTMTAVLESKSEKEKSEKDIKKEQKEFFDHWEGHDGDEIFEEVSLPEEYPSKGFTLKSEGKKWYIHTSFKDRKMTKPFALFVHTNNKESNLVTYNAIDRLEELAKCKGIPEEHIAKNKHKCSDQNNVNKLARTISLLLRHNVKIDKIVKVLDDIDEIPISSFVYRIKKFLSKYIKEVETGEKCPDCGSDLVYKEGCCQCSALCGYSRC